MNFHPFLRRELTFSAPFSSSRISRIWIISSYMLFTSLQFDKEIVSQKGDQMNNLKVIENELVPVYETSTGEKVVYGSELHEVLGVRTPYKDWSTRRLNDINAVENEDFEAAQICAPSGQTKKDHIIKLDTAKEMAMLERNEKGKQVRRYFIQVEKKYKSASLATQELSPQLQVMINLEIEQKRQAEKLEHVEERIESIREVVAIDTTSWREDTGRILRKIGMECGDSKSYQDVRAESYQLLEKRMGVNVKQRLTNKRRRMADEGVCKSRRDKLNYLDVIADDKKLIEGYTAIVKELAIKYGVA
nr:MAG TPA: antirepressor protein [Caudoviricetes sp.]